MPSSVLSRSFFGVRWWILGRWPLSLATVSEWFLWSMAVVSCAWVAAFILLRSVQPYPLDAFEEYEMHKSMRWADGAPLYGAPTREPFPEAYPPLYFLLLGSWQRLVGHIKGMSRELAHLCGLEHEEAKRVLIPAGAGYCVNPHCGRWVTGGPDRLRSGRCDRCRKHRVRHGGEEWQPVAEEEPA